MSAQLRWAGFSFTFALVPLKSGQAAAWLMAPSLVKTLFLDVRWQSPVTENELDKPREERLYGPGSISNVRGIILEYDIKI